MRERWSAIALGANLALAPALALAAAPPLRVGLEYDERAAPSGCPSRLELQGAVAEQLGYDPFVEAAAERELSVRVAIRRGRSGTEAVIEWLTPERLTQGERRLASESEECTEIASGVAFAVAVQLQLRAASAAPESPPSPPAQPPAPAQPSGPAVEREKPTAPGRRRVVLAGAGAFVQRGLQPDTALGFRTFGALQGRLWSVGLDAHGTLPSRWRAPAGAGFSATTLGLGVSPCLRALPVEICALGTVAQLSVRGEGVDRVRSPSAAVAGLGLRLQLAWPELQHLTALAHVEAWAPLTRREVVLNHETVWATAPVVLGAGLDLAAIFR